MRIDYHKNFAKHYERISPKLRSKFNARLKLFVKNPFAPELNNHALTGKYLGYRSFNITGDWRAVYEVQETGIKFYAIDTHSNLYK
jgi:addiction module RelE/StbE family toxin